MNIDTQAHKGKLLVQFNLLNIHLENSFLVQKIIDLQLHFLRFICHKCLNNIMKTIYS